MTSMKSMFYYCLRYEGRGIGAWDVSSVEDMRQMFLACRVFNAAIGAWDTSAAVLSFTVAPRVSNP